MGLKVVKLGAEWCGPCRLLAPVLEKVQSNFQDVEFLLLDVDNDLEEAAKYPVQALPTMLFYKDDVLVDKMVGFFNQEKIEQRINALK